MFLPFFRLEELEMKKILEQRKREKEDDKLARQRVRDMIEADKAARREKAAATAGVQTQSPPVPAAVPIPDATNAAAPQRKNYNETKLQVRTRKHSHRYERGVIYSKYSFINTFR